MFNDMLLRNMQYAAIHCVVCRSKLHKLIWQGVFFQVICWKNPPMLDLQTLSLNGGFTTSHSMKNTNLINTEKFRIPPLFSGSGDIISLSFYVHGQHYDKRK